MDMAHTDWSQLWSTGRSDRVASFSLDDDDDDVILPSYPHRHTRTFVPCLHTSSAACYTDLRGLAAMVVDGTVCGDRLTIGGRSTWIPACIPWLATRTRGGCDPAATPHRPPTAPRLSGYRCTYVRHDLSPPVTESDRREHGIPNTSGPRSAIGSNSWHAPISIPSPAQIEPTTALRRGRRRRPPCIPIRRHPGK